MTLKKKPFENIVGKGENAGNQHFLLSRQCFLLISVFKLTFILSPANASNLDQSKNLSFGKVLSSALIWDLDGIRIIHCTRVT